MHIDNECDIRMLLCPCVMHGGSMHHTPMCLCGSELLTLATNMSNVVCLGGKQLI